MMKKLLWMSCFMYLLIGSAHVVVGSVMEDLLGHYGVGYKDGGQLIFLQFAGFLVGVLLVPWCSRKLGRRGTILLSLGSLTVGELVYSFLPPWEWMLMIAPVAGFGFGAMEAAVGAFIIEFTADQKAVAISRVDVFFGLGALIMPAAASVLISKHIWYVSFPIVASVSLLLVLLFSFMSFGSLDKLLDHREKLKIPAPDATEGKHGVSYSFGTVMIIALMTVFFALYVGIEMSFVNFLPSMLIESSGVSHSTGALGVTIFWFTMSIGRFFAGNLAEKLGYHSYLLISCAGSLLFLAAFSAAFVSWANFLLILLFGLLMAGIFPIALIFTNHLLPGMVERITSLMVASGGIGGALIPLFTGEMMDAFSAGVTEWMLAGFMFVLLIIMLLAYRLGTGRKRSPKVS